MLLNSDTLVFGDWLQRLRAAAYSAPRGTVTPLTNTARSQVIRTPAGLIDPEDAAALHTLAALRTRAAVEIPVGVGFCLYMRRDCLQDTGDLDAPCSAQATARRRFLSAGTALGWSHRLAADVFVYHGGGVSFGSRREALLDRSDRLMNLRYPGYDRFIGDFAQGPLRPMRRRLDEQRLSAAKVHSCCF